MDILNSEQRKIRLWQLVTVILLLLIAFFNCFKTTHDLQWAYDTDFDRDMAFIQGTLDGNFGKDPNIKNEYLWYNPLLFLTETAIVKITGLPVNIVVARAGTYLNLLGPIAFIFMIWKFFNLNTVLASLVSYLFLASGNLLGWGAATYSPWLYPGAFMQFIFYINILLCYQAFDTQRYSWFIVLGFLIGISFLGHTAPTVLILLIVFSIQLENIIRALINRQYQYLRVFFLQGVCIIIPFLITSFPLLYFIIGKYNLHIVNRMAFEYLDYLFIPINFFHLIRANLSITLILSITGFIAFYKNCRDVIVRKLIFSWLYISAVLFLYTTLVPVIENKYKVDLPGLVPSFHFFFYLKAVESVFFGYGFFILGHRIINFVSGLISRKRRRLDDVFSSDKIFLVVVVVIVILYLPRYSSRKDFVFTRKASIEKESNTDKIQVYDWIVKNIPDNEVILCEHNDAIFPVMAAGRKMVATNITFSNPYIDFGKREIDRQQMLEFLKSGQPESVKKLFYEYKVSAVILKNVPVVNQKIISQLFNQITFQNNQYTIFKKL